MMENKCNKTPNSKYLDHVYCHTGDNKTYIRANNNNAASGGGGTGGTTTGADFLALLKENKQLKTMLILHLELIQEQNEQLLSKDKQLASQGEELESLRSKSNQLEANVQELQKQLQRQLKRVAAVSGERSSLPPPPLAKIQCKTELPHTSIKALSPALKAGGALISTSIVPNKNANIIGECNGKLISKIILHRVSLPGRGLRAGTSSPHSTTTSETVSEADDTASKSHQDDDDEEDVDGEEEEGEEEEMEEDEVEEEDADADADAGTGNTTTEDDSNDVPIATVAKHHAKNQRRQMPPLSITIPRGAKPRTSTVITPPGSVPPATSASLQVCVTPPTPSRGKQMPLMRWHAPEIHSESESASCDSSADIEHHSNTTMTSPPTSKSPALSTTKATNDRGNLGPPSHCHPQQRQTRSKTRRTTYISTPQLYSTREWEDEAFVCDYEFIKEEANALRADKPQLEIPKWTEHDLSPSYCIEGTEDLCDDTFLKRHNKFEVDEKRRKKWDVQQIREQRRIEKLKRRHCKDELLVPQEPQPLLTFYPQPDAIQNIYFSDELPVQAFGELIPKLRSSSGFSLPWLEPHITPTATCNSSGSGSMVVLASGTTATSGNFNTASSTQAQQNTSFVFLKKRRRQQSSSTQNPKGRRRSAAANAAAAASPALITATVAVSPVAPTTASAKNSPSTPTSSDATLNEPNNSNEATN